MLHNVYSIDKTDMPRSRSSKKRVDAESFSANINLKLRKILSQCFIVQLVYNMSIYVEIHKENTIHCL